MYFSKALITTLAVLTLTETNIKVQGTSCHVCGVDETTGEPNPLRPGREDFILGYGGATCQDRENDASENYDADDYLCKSYYQQCRYRDNCCNIPCQICCGQGNNFEIPASKENNMPFIVNNSSNTKTCKEIEAEAQYWYNSGFCGMFQTDFYQSACCEPLEVPPDPEDDRPEFPVCDICDSEDMVALNDLTGAQYHFFGLYHSCEELHGMGMGGEIPEEMCQSLKTTYDTIGNCCVPKPEGIEDQPSDEDVCTPRTCTKASDCCDGWTCDWRTMNAAGIMQCNLSEQEYQKARMKRSCRGMGGSRCNSGNRRHFLRHRHNRRRILSGVSHYLRDMFLNNNKPEQKQENVFYVS